MYHSLSFAALLLSEMHNYILKLQLILIPQINVMVRDILKVNVHIYIVYACIYRVSLISGIKMIQVAEDAKRSLF
jgi:hypothetical protein